MSDWLVRAGASSVDASARHTVIVFRTRRVPKIRPQDQLFLMEGTAAEGKFTHYARVVGVSKEAQSEDSDNLTIQITVEHWEELPQPPSIAELRYSLTFIWNLRKPWLHFRRGIRRLPSEDAETITTGEVFVARTGFFELMSAIPEPMQRAFRIEQLQKSDLNDEWSSFAHQFAELHEFISRRIESVGYLLAELESLVDRLNIKDQTGLTVRHAFTQEGESARAEAVAVDYVDTQRKAFRDYFRSLKEQSITSPNEFLANVLDETGHALAARDTLPREAEFERIFLRVR